MSDVEMRKELAPESFIKAERNLETLGFFTPSSNKLKKLKEKVIQIRRKVDGEVQELTITILPSAKYGLPSTVHQDFYRGFQKLMSAQLRGDGEVPRHIAFTTAELLDSMGIERKRQSGKWYRMVYEWLKVMHLTGIESKGCIWRADEQQWVSDTVHVFERIVGSGNKLEDGSVADRHHVWLSDWQYENINARYLLSINHELYKSLDRKISKSLFSLLHCWFYVGDGTYRVKYWELCQWLGLKVHKRKSYVMRQLDPSHEELKEKGFLDRWTYKRLRDGNVLITWYAGARYYADRAKLEQLRRAEYKQLEMPLEMPNRQKREFSEAANALVQHFHQQLGHLERQPTMSELEKAEELIARGDARAARFVVDFAMQEAEKTHFAMRDFGAVKLYADEGLARYRQQQVHERQSQEGRAQEAADLVKFLHEQLGHAECIPTQQELAAATEMLVRNGVHSARTIVGYAIEDAQEMNIEMTDFSQVSEIINQVTAGK